MRSIVLILIAAASMDAYSQTDGKFVRKGNGDYKDGNFQQAEVEYRKALEKNPQSYKADYNLGNALYRQKQYDAAASRYAGLAEKGKDKKEISRYYYNLGNTMYENQKYKESVEAFKNALRNDPNDMDAKHNLQLALRMLNEQKQQQNQGNQQQDSKDQDNRNKENQDQQSKDQQQPSQQQNEDAKPQESLQKSKGEISPADAERILQALENEEKEVMKRVQNQKEKVKKVPVEKNW